MANLLLLLLKHPLRTLYFGHSFLSQLLLIILRRVLLPQFPTYQSLRLQIHRAYLSSATITFPDLPNRLPVSDQPVERVRKLGRDVPAYIVPGTRSLGEFAATASKTTPGHRRCVALFAHGGGYARGEARMYLNYMERWVREAAAARIDLVFVSVEYPLSSQAAHPAQMNTFIQTWQHIIDSDVSPKNIVFMGDSAGGGSRLDLWHYKNAQALRFVALHTNVLQGGLSILSAIELRRRGLPQPAATVLISPWIDMAMSAWEGGNPAVESDYFIQANSAVDTLVGMFVGPDRARDSPEINPLYSDPADIAGLSPQFMLVGGGEFALHDSKQWAKVCKGAGIEHAMVVEWGQLHIYAMGSMFVDPSVRRKTDDRIINWIKDHIE